MISKIAIGIVAIAGLGYVGYSSIARAQSMDVGPTTVEGEGFDALSQQIMIICESEMLGGPIFVQAAPTNDGEGWRGLGQFAEAEVKLAGESLRVETESMLLQIGADRGSLLFEDRSENIPCMDGTEELYEAIRPFVLDGNLRSFVADLERVTGEYSENIQNVADRAAEEVAEKEKQIEELRGEIADQQSRIGFLEASASEVHDSLMNTIDELQGVCGRRETIGDQGCRSKVIAQLRMWEPPELTEPSSASVSCRANVRMLFRDIQELSRDGQQVDLRQSGIEERAAHAMNSCGI
ncbi:kinetochore Spc7 family protein [Histidinibacterium aquaticum]|uniref:Uncharacterized protein n=1 Tax=Histidinibacterium aquaticum TaxID=2613962 RepID=A0A5J5GKD3_9RHOB|nr:hypothetical protein [Histidinibacterium aquaticum]KAA9008781.1 hypothetical protein F3S47_05810 [Histidinibacterium aquaticum]